MARLNGRFGGGRPAAQGRLPPSEGDGRSAAPGQNLPAGLFPHTRRLVGIILPSADRLLEGSDADQAPISRASFRISGSSRTSLVLLPGITIRVAP
jgi:hypothetical protein